MLKEPESIEYLRSFMELGMPLAEVMRRLL